MPAVAESVPVGGEPSGWRHARLIPTSGIRSQQEQEQRATSCLLAVMHGVPEFGHALLKDLGAPKSPVIETFAEVRLKDAAGKTVIPDGAIVCRRGHRNWTCLVEVKTGAVPLRDEQVEGYLDVARENNFDGVLTISTQITASHEESPVCPDKRKLRKTKLWHLSWWRILTEAVVQPRYRGISNPDQEWVLRELIHYLSSESSGALGFEDMGAQWVPLRKAATNGTLRQADVAVRDVAERWEQFSQYLCLTLSQQLGRTVTAVRKRGQSPQQRQDQVAKQLAGDSLLATSLRVPDAVGPLEVIADLRSRATATSVYIDAPGEGRVKGRISWLLRQLTEASDQLVIKVAYPNTRELVAATLEAAREDPTRLYHPFDPKRPPRQFVLTRSRPMGQKRGRVEGSFVRETRAQVESFYQDIVEHLRAWQPPAPKIRVEPALEAEPQEEGNGVPPVPVVWEPPHSLGEDGAVGAAADPNR